jgi:hypothetical protein
MIVLKLLVLITMLTIIATGICAIIGFFVWLRKK